jgi:hypothetical protein
MDAASCAILAEGALRFEIKWGDESGTAVAANQFMRDGKLIHFWWIDTTRMKQSYVLTLHSAGIRSIRPVYPPKEA